MSLVMGGPKIISRLGVDRAFFAGLRIAWCTDGLASGMEEINALRVITPRGPFEEKGREDILQKPPFSNSLNLQGGKTGPPQARPSPTSHKHYILGKFKRFGA